MAFSSLRRWFTRSHAPLAEVTPRDEELSGAEEQYLKGVEFADGLGVAQDYGQAARWFARAAEQNHAQAQLNLATLYRQGQGVGRDPAKSLQWLTRAAKLGNAAAQYRLGVQQHLVGRVGRATAAPETRIEALMWVRLSAAQGYRGAESACQFVTSGMTWEEVAEGGRRAAAFVVGSSDVRIESLSPG